MGYEDHEFNQGDRGFSHYTMKWGTVERIKPLDDGWFTVRNDDGTTDFLNAVRFVTPEVAKRNGYGDDPFGHLNPIERGFALGINE